MAPVAHDRSAGTLTLMGARVGTVSYSRMSTTGDLRAARTSRVVTDPAERDALMQAGLEGLTKDMGAFIIYSQSALKKRL